MRRLAWTSTAAVAMMPLVTLAACADLWGFRNLAGTADAAVGTDAATSADGGSSGGPDSGGARDARADSLQDAEAMPEDAGSSDAGDAAIPTGWTLVELALTTSTGAPPICGVDWSGDAFPFDGGDGLNAPSAFCGCSCGAIGVACGITLTADSDTVPGPGCVPGGTGAASITIASGACQPTGPSSNTGLYYFHNSAPIVGAAGCPPEPSVTLPPTTWTRVATVCTPSVSGGSSPAHDNGFQTCIAADGDLPCPSTDYLSRSVEYGSTQDGRTCTECTCLPTGLSCDGTITVFANTSCTPGTTGTGCSSSSPCSAETENTCTGYVGDWSVLYAATAAGSCTNSTPAPTGTATAQQPVTFCCTP